MAVINSYLIDAYADMARFAYESSGQTVFGPSGQQYVPYYSVVDGDYGFQARAFFNTTTRELVFAFAGTEGAKDPFSLPEFAPDLITNMQLSLTGLPSQVSEAVKFINKAEDIAEDRYGAINSYTYVGHSLGGFLAQTASDGKPEGEVIAFNAPGVGGFFNFPQEHASVPRF